MFSPLNPLRLNPTFFSVISHAMLNSPQDGGFHPVDSSAIAFEIAARAAFKEGAGKAKPIVMEPIMKARLGISF